LLHAHVTNNAEQHQSEPLKLSKTSQLSIGIVQIESFDDTLVRPVARGVFLVCVSMNKGVMVVGYVGHCSLSQALPLLDPILVMLVQLDVHIIVVVKLILRHSPATFLLAGHLVVFHDSLDHKVLFKFDRVKRALAESTYRPIYSALCWLIGGTQRLKAQVFVPLG